MSQQWLGLILSVIMTIGLSAGASALITGQLATGTVLVALSLLFFWMGSRALQE